MPDNDSGTEIIGIEWKIEGDQKSQKESTTAFANIISLVKDLAIIGKVAGESLGKMWSGMQDTIKASLDEFDDINLALTVGVDPDELNKLKYAVGQIGGSNKDVMNMLGQTDKVVQSFRNAATGPEELAKFFSDMGKQGVSEESMTAIEQAIKDNDIVEAIRTLAATREELGEEFSNFMSTRDMSSLGVLENDFQYKDWNEAWAKSMDNLTNANVEGLNDLENGMADIAFAGATLKRYLGGEFGKSIELFGNALLTATSNIIAWADRFKLTETGQKVIGAISGAVENDLDLISGEKGFGEWLSGQKDNIKNLKGVIESITKDKFGATEGMSVSEFGESIGNSGVGFLNQPTEGSTTIWNLDNVTVVADNKEQMAGGLSGELGGL